MRVSLFVALIAWASWTAAAEIAGVKLDDKVRIAPSAPELVLNGAGIRTRFMIKVYVGGLYLTEKKSAAAEVLALPGAKRVVIVMLRDVTGQQMADAVNEGFQANNAPAEVERYNGQLADLVAIMSALGNAKKNDIIVYDYLPEAGTRVVINGEPKGKPLADEGFYRALLRVWLGERPVDGDLKRAMLGQS